MRNVRIWTLSSKLLHSTEKQRSIWVSLQCFSWISYTFFIYLSFLCFSWGFSALSEAYNFKHFGISKPFPLANRKKKHKSVERDRNFYEPTAYVMYIESIAWKLCQNIYSTTVQAKWISLLYCLSYISLIVVSIYFMDSLCNTYFIQGRFIECMECMERNARDAENRDHK